MSGAMQPQAAEATEAETTKADKVTKATEAPEATHMTWRLGDAQGGMRDARSARCREAERRGMRKNVIPSAPELRSGLLRGRLQQSGSPTAAHARA